MGLFSKKSCSICEGDIGLLSNTKLQDGNLCKNCAKKLSRFFHGAKQCTVAQITEQLAYRTRNEIEVSKFHTSRTVGSGTTKLYVDENARKFIISSNSNFTADYPDVIDLSAVTGVEIKMDERRTEIYDRDKEGHNVSFNPPHYKYYFSLEEQIFVNHPYFSEIKFKLGEVTMEGMRGGAPVRPGSHHGPASPVRIGGAEQKPNPTTNAQFAELKKQGEEMKRILMSGREEARKAEVESPKPQMVICGYCGATFEANGSGECPFCSAPLG